MDFVKRIASIYFSIHRHLSSSHLLIMDGMSNIVWTFSSTAHPRTKHIFQEKRLIFYIRGCGASVVGESVAAALVTRRFLCLAASQIYQRTAPIGLCSLVGPFTISP